jgi:hypothetical protein
VDKFTKWIEVKPVTSITGQSQWNSSKRSCTSLACPTTLSWIM